MRHIASPATAGDVAQRFYRALRCAGENPPRRSFLVVDDKKRTAAVGITWGEVGKEDSEAGIMLIPEIHNRGYATEALHGVIHYIIKQPNTPGIFIR